MRFTHFAMILSRKKPFTGGSGAGANEYAGRRALYWARLLDGKLAEPVEDDEEARAFRPL